MTAELEKQPPALIETAAKAPQKMILLSMILSKSAALIETPLQGQSKKKTR